MQRFIHPFVSLTAVAAAIVLIAACGGGDGDASAPVGAQADEPDAQTVAEITRITTDADAALTKLGLDGTLTTTVGEKRIGLYPGVVQTNLVANKPKFGAQILEPLMQEGWGIAIRPAGLGGHFWVGATRTGKSLQYVGDVGTTPLFQDELAVVDTLGAVTGVSFNPGAQFTITQAHANGAITAPAKFFFANLTGTITAWTERARAGGGFDHPADSVPVVDGRARGSAFFGVTVTPDGKQILAADFGAQPALRVYDGSFAEQDAYANPYRADAADPKGFAAFNVQTLGNSVFAMYGRHAPLDATVPPAPEGRLAEFDGQGKLVAQWRGRGLLKYPWGVQFAPEGFGLYSGCLLVGNFGDGSIVAFHPRLKTAIDYVRDDRGRRVIIDALWGLQFGNGASLGEAKHMYFAAGGKPTPGEPADGVFGKLQANPGTLPLLGGLSLCR